MAFLLFSVVAHQLLLTFRAYTSSPFFFFFFNAGLTDSGRRIDQTLVQHVFQSAVALTMLSNSLLNLLIQSGFVLKPKVLLVEGRLAGLGWWRCFQVWAGWTCLLVVSRTQLCDMCVPSGVPD